MTPNHRAKTGGASKQPRAERRDENAKVEISAGGLVYKRTPQGVRVAFVMDPYGKWTFAKGHVEAGESLTDAALRETREEMGLGRLRIVAALGSIDIWFRDRYRPETKGQLIHKYVHYFLMEAPSKAKGSPQRKEKIRKLIWVDLRRAERMLGYDDVRETLHKATGILNSRRDRTLPGGQGGTRTVASQDDMPSPRPEAPRGHSSYRPSEHGPRPANAQKGSELSLD